MPRLMNRQQGHVATEQNSLWMIYRKAQSYQQKQSTLFRSSIQLKKPFISSSFTARSEHPQAASTDSSKRGDKQNNLQTTTRARAHPHNFQTPRIDPDSLCGADAAAYRTQILQIRPKRTDETCDSIDSVGTDPTGTARHAIFECANHGKSKNEQEQWGRGTKLEIESRNDGSCH